MFYLRWTSGKFARTMYAIVRDQKVTWTITSANATKLKEARARLLLRKFKGGRVEMVATDEI
jgi:hypothetical protein